MADIILDDEALTGETANYRSPEEMVPHISDHGLLYWETLIKKQKRDEEIKQLALHAVDECEAAMVPGCYLWKNDILMRKWQPPGVPALQEWKVIYQIVLPPIYQSDILSLVNETAMAGHLGINKTYQNILDHLYWPEVLQDCHVALGLYAIVMLLPL